MPVCVLLGRIEKKGKKTISFFNEVIFTEINSLLLAKFSFPQKIKMIMKNGQKLKKKSYLCSENRLIGTDHVYAYLEPRFPSVCFIHISVYMRARIRFRFFSALHISLLDICLV